MEREFSSIIQAYLPDISTNYQLLHNVNVDVCLDGNVIELYGDYWHMNPSIYSSEFYNRSTHLFAHEKWNTDIERENAIINSGKKLKIVWETEYHANPEKVLKECVEFLNE